MRIRILVTNNNQNVNKKGLSLYRLFSFYPLSFFASLLIVSAILTLTSCQSAPDVSEQAKQLFYKPENEYVSSARLTIYDSLLKVAPDFYSNRYQFEKGKASLFGGKTDEAIEIFTLLNQKLKSGSLMADLQEHQLKQIPSYLALSHLRSGEQQNCILNHTAASCIVPIGTDGLHQDKHGSEQALLVLEEILKSDPQDLNSRWLYNLASMTLGKYPEQVPPIWLLDPAKFTSEYPLLKFTDVAADLKLDVDQLSGGCIADDFNNDYLPDLLVSSWFAGHAPRLFLQFPGGYFQEVTTQAGLDQVAGGLNLVQADYDNDGWLDFLILRGGWLAAGGKIPNSLMRNNGDGSFTDVTVEAGLLSYHPTQTATWADFNNDGWLDLFIGNESIGEAINPCELYINQQNGKFQNVILESGITIGLQQENARFIKGVTTGDYNHDGWMDLYISTLDPGRSNILYRNNGLREGIPVFEDVTIEANLDQSYGSFATWFWDYDNDGWEDLFVGGYYRDNLNFSVAADFMAELLGLPHSAETMHLYRNTGDGSFDEVTWIVNLNRIAHAMAANYGDLDNDGWLDFYLGTGEVNFASLVPNRMFRNAEGTHFQDVTTSGGFGNIQKGHGIAFADLDLDGDQDIYAVMGGAYEGDNYQNLLFHNPYEGHNNWVTINLRGKQSNHFGVGSQLEIQVNEYGITRKIYRRLNSGGSFGASPLKAQVGLGQATRIEKLVITWAGSQYRQEFANVSVNQHLLVKENQNELEYLTLAPIRWQQNGITVCR